MSDCFALFGEPRRPWLDAARLKEKFHGLTAAHHPDVNQTGAGPNFTELNAAYQTLSDPARRVGYLLQLERPEAVARETQPPPALVELFLRIGALRGTLDRYHASEAQAATPLHRALLAGEKNRCSEELESCADEVRRSGEAALSELRALDLRWERGERDFAALAAVQARLIYLGKWSAQLAEARFRLGD